MIVVFFIFLGLFSVVLLGAVAKKSYRLKNLSTQKKDEILLSVIIPFRNEETNLPRLIACIQNQDVPPFQILFVDDHSDDEGKALLEKAFEREEYVSIISLPETVEGKKGAVDFGIKMAKGHYCLTLDADVEFSPNYFKSILKFSNSDMIIAPVVMTSVSFLSRFFGFEYMLFNAFNYTFSSFYINSASGANLLFSKEKYLAFNTLETHNSLSSGDDHFLLRDFQFNKASITLNNLFDCAVYSRSVDNWKGYFNQRIRWFSKTKQKTNWKEQCVGALLFIYLMGSFILSIHFLIGNDYTLLFALFGIRFLIDFLVFSNYTARLGKLNQFLLYPVFFILYPAIFVAVLVGSLFYKPKWKGRAIVKKE